MSDSDSLIDPTKPTSGRAYTADVRLNFGHTRTEVTQARTLAAAAREIAEQAAAAATAAQQAAEVAAQAAEAAAILAQRAVQRTGDSMSGHLVLELEPTADNHAVTKAYADAHGGGGGGEPGEPGPPGEVGPPGEQGEQGQPGSLWREGKGPPDDGLGIDGDFYLNGYTGDVYERTAGTYRVVCTLLGPRGDIGPPGLQGGPGPPGAPGPESFPDAPESGGPYGRAGGAWREVLPVAGGQVNVLIVRDSLTSNGPAALNGNAHIGGDLTLDHDPAGDLEAATKKYVDGAVDTAIGGLSFLTLGDADARYLPYGGGELLGPLILHADPQDATEAANKRYVDEHVPDLSGYLPRSGGTMTGGLVATLGSVTLPSLAIGDPNTGFLRTSTSVVLSIAASSLVVFGGTEIQFGAPLNMVSRKITDLADPTLPTDAVNKRYADALTPPPPDLSGYARLDGAQFDGPLITQRGTSNTNLGLSVGDNSSGFWRSGLYLICVLGGGTVWQTSATEWMMNVTLNMATKGISNVGAPTASGDAANRLYVDQRHSPSVMVVLPADVTTSMANWINIAPSGAFSIPRGGNSRIMVSVIFDCTYSGNDGQIVLAGVRLSPFPTVVRKVFLYKSAGQCPGVSAQFVLDVTGTSIGTFDVQLSNLLWAGGTSPDITVSANSQIVVTDLGPR